MTNYTCDVTVAAKRIDELEKENRDLDREKRETRRELNNMKLAMHDEIEVRLPIEGAAHGEHVCRRKSLCTNN